MLSRRSLSSSFAQARSGNPCHLRLEQTPDGDQVVQQLHVGIMFKRDAEHRGIEQVPELARLNRRAAPLFHPHEPALFQELQPFSQNGPAETELVAQHRLRWKHRPLGQYTSDDPSRQLLHHDRGQSCGPCRSAQRADQWATRLGWSHGRTHWKHHTLSEATELPRDRPQARGFRPQRSRARGERLANEPHECLSQPGRELQGAKRLICRPASSSLAPRVPFHSSRQR